MKRTVLSSVLAAVLAAILLLSGCSAGKQEDVNAAGFHLTVPQTTYAPGDEVAVTLMLSDYENVACFDVKLTFDGDLLTSSHADECALEDFETLSNLKDGVVVVKGYTVTTLDFTADPVVTLYFTVNQGASGKASLNAKSTLFMIGTDDSGDEVNDIAKDTDLSCSLRFDVKG